MADEVVWTLTDAGGNVVSHVGNCDRDQAETIKAQLESSGHGPLKMRKGRKHQIQKDADG